MSNTTKVITLFKSKKEPIDLYLQLFEQEGFKVLFIPVLQFEFFNLEELKSTLSKIENETLVITSKRAVEAIGKVNEIKNLQYVRTIFVVGKETKQSLIELGIPEIKIQGENSGSAHELANLIVDYFKDKEIKKCTFICGTKRRNELPDILKQNEIIFDEIQVYKTTNSEDLEQKIQDLTKLMNEINKCKICPSGVEFFKEFASNNEGAMKLIESSKIASIGTTTGEVLFKEILTTKACKKYLAKLDIIAETPKADSLLKSIEEHFQ